MSETCGGENAVSVYNTGSLQPLVAPSAGIDTLVVTTVPGVVLEMGHSINFTMVVNNGTDAGYFISTQAIDADYYTGFNTTSFAADKPGRFTVSVRAMNEISYKDYMTDIYVYIPITSIATDYISFEKTGELISFTVTVLNGTNITCEADFGDGDSESLFKTDDSLPFSFSHTYATAEVYVANITCYNNVSYHTDIGAVIIQDVISNIQLSNDNPVRYLDDVNVSWSLDTGTNVTFNLLMDGRETRLENYVFSNLSGSAVLPHVFYNWTGQHALALVAYNLVSHEDYNTSVLIEIPIDQVTIVPNGTFHAVDAVINFTITIAKGSNLTIDLQLDDVTSVELTSPRNSYNHVFTYQHSYSYIGEKTINLTVSNIHGSVSSMCNLTTEVSVADVEVVADDVLNPVDFELYVIFKVVNASDIPTNAVSDIDFGDSSSVSSVRTDIQDHHQNITHKYETHGVFVLNVTIYNNVSTKALSKDLKVGGPISNITVAINRMFIPVGSALIATADVGYGSLITYIYDLGDGTAITQNYTRSYPTASDTVEHIYNDTGNYEVTIWASNSFNNVSETLTVHVQNKVAGLILTSNAPVRFNKPITFLLTVISPGTDTCFMFDFNDGSVMLYGVASCPSRPEYKGIKFKENSGSSLMVSNVYQFAGTYNVTVNSSNEVSWDVVSLPVIVLEYLCIEPQVQILGLSKDELSPVTIKRSKRFELSANIDTQCDPPVNTVYNWVMERVSVSGNQSHQMVDVIEEITNPTNGLPSMTVPSRYLPYGVYKISLTVSYEVGSDYNTTDYSFIEIIPSQLKFSISGDYLRTVYVGDDLVVNGSASYDPDYSGNTVKGLQYKWYCRLLNESLSTDNNSIPMESISTESPGCFGNGFGYLNQTSESLHVNSYELVVNLVYVFGLVISKDSRVMYGEQRVKTVGSRIIPIEMRCFDNCGAKVVANQPLRLESVCKLCALQEFPFHWELFFIDAGTYQQLNITLWIAEGENTTDVEQTGFVGPNLALNPGSLAPGVDYRLRLTYDAMITERDISINFPPYGGHCYADKQLGMEFKTMFVIYCEDWLDEGDRPVRAPVEDSRYKAPLTFKFSYRARGLTSRPHVFYEVTGTNVQTPEVMFRSGLDEEDHYIDLYVEVADSSGATNNTTLSIKVIPSSGFVSDVYKDTDYKRFEAEKDISALLLINMGVIDRLHELSNTNSPVPVTAQMRENVVSHISEHADWVETPSQVELMSDILKEATQKPEELSVTSRKKAVQVFSTLLGSLDSVFNESSDSVTQQRVAKGLCESFIGLMLSNSFNSTCETDCESKKTLAASTQSVFESRDSLVRMLLKGSVAGERATVITSTNGDLTYKVQRTKASSLSNSSTGTGSEKQTVVFPDITAKLLSDDAASVDVEVIESSKLQIDDADSVQTRTTSVTLYNHGNKLDISQLTDAISVFVYPTSDLTSNTIDVAENYTGDPFYVKISLERADVAVGVQFKPEDAQNASFAYFVSYNSVPTNQSSDIHGTLPVEDEAGEQWALSFNVASFPSYSEEKSQDVNPSVYIGIIPLHDTNETSSVLNVTIFSAGCQYYDTQSSSWKHDGLKIGKRTALTKVECLASHLTSFGASFFVPPNTIDFKNVFAKFSNLADNAAVFSTIIVVIVLYLVVIFFVRRADKKDVDKWSVVPLRDNLLSDVYHYQVTVFTGMRRNAGTKSQVYLVLGGEQGDTEIRSLEDKNKRKPDRGSVNSYVLSVPQSLGSLLFLRIWHDNSGKGIDSDWYLNMVVVKDIQTDIKYVFLCDRWLAVDKDDGLIERFIPVSTNEELKSFGHIFAFKSRQDLTDGHLWFSVLSRPTWSTFTRVQRLSCCLSLLFTTMVANAMWYGTTPSQGTQDVHLGPFTFSPQELTTSLMMSLIVVPINLLIVTLFRKASPKPPKRGKSSDALNKQNKPGHLSSMWSSGGIFTVEPVQVDKQHSPNVVTKAPEAKKPCCVWPYWVTYVAWLLVALSIAAPAFFTVLYSLEWGADKSSRWLTSFVLSFVESVLLVQPAKVLAVAMVLALIFKKVDIEEAPPGELQGEIIQYNQSAKGNYSSYAGAVKPAHRRPYVEKPPDFSSVSSVRKYRKKQNRMIEILKDIGSYVFYLVIIAIICYENRDEKSFRTVDNIRNMMVKDIHLVGTSRIKGFEGLSSFEEFWAWSVDRLVPALYVKTTFNSDNVTNNRRSFLGDHVHYRVGPPRLRQARALQDSCKPQAPLNRLITTCIAEYGLTNYDDVSYDVNWTPLNTSVTNNPAEPWLYQGVSKLNGIPSVGYFATYGGGGYVAVLGNDDNTATNMLLDLKENRWLDRQTRAVILEVNVYNPYVNLFCAVSLVLEFPPTGSAISYAHISPLRLYRYVGPSALFMVVTDLIFVAFTIYFIVRLVQQMKVRGRKYLQDFWNVVEFLNVTAAILCCAFYGMHFVITALTLSDFQEHPGEFVNFQRIVLWDDVFTCMQGFLLFLAMLKLLRLIRFNTKITQLSTTLKKSVGPIVNFLIVFSIVFFAFTQFAYLVFGPQSSEYFSFVTSMETLFSMLLMKVNIEEIIMADDILGPLFLFTFTLVVIFILVNMLLSILNEVFTGVRLDTRCRPDDPKMVEFMYSELKRIIGLSPTSHDGKEKAKVVAATQQVPVERWLTAENDLDRFSPEPLEGDNYWVSLPPNSTDLYYQKSTKAQFYDI
ncbi:polycystic kidney disease protein 1-like 2 [Haliotis rubra]|uniref:polycystic kidney disease protein 1-like 2 n=1 Tax=Haliotis rubra TaxID=36100 RepID=UPI001EE570FE|nr:polycystic kidney disease protein 1-like 2 [Haliotis rubra]